MARATRNWIPNDKVLNDGMAKIKQIAEAAIIESLSELAKTSISVSILNRGYTHRTFNLNDSYGFGIYHNGILVKKWLNSSEATSPDSKGGSGAQMGSLFLDRFISEGDWQLVVFAGEFYAADLETFHRLNVLSNAYQYTEQNFLQDFKRI